jgi:hypothetical protein
VLSMPSRVRCWKILLSRNCCRLSMHVLLFLPFVGSIFLFFSKTTLRRKVYQELRCTRSHVWCQKVDGIEIPVGPTGTYCTLCGVMDRRTSYICPRTRTTYEALSRAKNSQQTNRWAIIVATFSFSTMEMIHAIDWAK